MDASIDDENWQTDARWTDKVWNFEMQAKSVTEVKGKTENVRDNAQETGDSENKAVACDEHTKMEQEANAQEQEANAQEQEANNAQGKEANVQEQEVNAQEVWSDEERTVFKLKIKTLIPLVFQGPVFDKSHFDYRVRVFPVTYPDVCDPGFKTILSNAGSTRLSFDQHANVLELYVKRNSAKALMKGILFGSFEHSHVTVEVERRDPDWSKVEDGEPISFPTLANKATFKVNIAHVRQHLLDKRAVNGSASEKQRSLFLHNLPGNMDSTFLQLLFPVCLKCRMLEVSDSVRAAILEMRSVEMAFHHLVGITDFHIDGRTIMMGTSDISQHEAIQRATESKTKRTAQQGSSTGSRVGSQVTTTGTAAVALNQAVAKQTTNQGLQRVSEEESTKCLLGQSAEEGNQDCPMTQEPSDSQSTPSQLFAPSDTHNGQAQVSAPQVLNQV